MRTHVVTDRAELLTVDGAQNTRRSATVRSTRGRAGCLRAARISCWARNACTDPHFASLTPSAARSPQGPARRAGFEASEPVDQYRVRLILPHVVALPALGGRTVG